MDNKKKKELFLLIVAIAVIILIGVGSTFAYFSANVASEEGAVDVGAAVFEIALKDDASLSKANIIPSKEKYVNLAIDRLDENGQFSRPYKENNKTIIDKTVCIDDNLNEICSLYTFTVQNPMTDMELPLYVSLIPSVNTFTNLKFKIIEILHNEETGYYINEVIGGTWLVDSRYFVDDKTGAYIKDENGNKVPKPNFDELTSKPLEIKDMLRMLPKAKDQNTPSESTFTLVLWVDEIDQNQTTQDGGQMFAGGIVVSVGGGGNGITGVFSAGGVDDE